MQITEHDLIPHPRFSKRGTVFKCFSESLRALDCWNSILTKRLRDLGQGETDFLLILKHSWQVKGLAGAELLSMNEERCDTSATRKTQGLC